MEGQFSRYHQLVTNLARQSLDRAAAETGAIWMQARGQSVSVGAAAARVLLGDAVDEAAIQAGVAAVSQSPPPGGTFRFNDAMGFTRPVYHPLLVHLYLQAAARSPQVDAAVGDRFGPVAAASTHGDVSLRLWWALCAYGYGTLRNDAARIEAACAVAQSVVDRAGSDGALHARGEDDQLDAWTYRELSGLHALARLALAEGRRDWRNRVREIAAHHQAYTQPDYTTYQPWAVFAFLGEPDTVLFGDQQLHDTETNLHVQPAGAGVLAGLLLADAADALAGGR